ncbi:MAG: S41 family peptidase [Opitutales bacterium]
MPETEKPTVARRRRRLQLYVLFGLLGGLAGTLAYQIWVSGPAWQELFRMWRVMAIVNKAYVDEQPSAYPEMSERAMREMINGLDRHSRWLSEEQAKDFEQGIRQQYSGIGVSIRPVELGLEINEVFPKSPAEKAGLLPFDVITAAEGTDLAGLSSSEAVSIIKGPTDSPVEIRIQRRGQAESFAVTVIRGAIPIENVRNVRMERPGIGVIEINEFGEKTAENFGRALDRLEGEGMRGLVLDLRNNPGGSLLSAIDVTSFFLDVDEVVVSTRGRARETQEVFVSQTPRREKEYPIVVLIDGGSASASEIVAGALQEQISALVVGERSVGKGSVQSYIPLPDGDAIKLTTAKWYLPSGKAVEDNGVEPDVEVILTNRERMRLFLQKRHDAKSILSDEEFLERFGFERLEDSQLKTALDILTASVFAGAN